LKKNIYRKREKIYGYGGEQHFLNNISARKQQTQYIYIYNKFVNGDKIIATQKCASCRVIQPRFFLDLKRAVITTQKKYFIIVGKYNIVGSI